MQEYSMKRPKTRKEIPTQLAKERQETKEKGREDLQDSAGRAKDGDIVSEIAPKERERQDREDSQDWEAEHHGEARERQETKAKGREDSQASVGRACSGDTARSSVPKEKEEVQTTWTEKQRHRQQSSKAASQMRTNIRL